MKHFTALVLGQLGLKKTWPEACGLVQSQTRMNEDLLLAQEAWSSENLQAREPLRKTWGVETSVLTPSAPQAARGISISEQTFHCPRARRAALYKPSHGIKNTAE